MSFSELVPTRRKLWTEAWWSVVFAILFFVLVWVLTGVGIAVLAGLGQFCVLAACVQFEEASK